MKGREKLFFSWVFSKYSIPIDFVSDRNKHALSHLDMRRVRDVAALPPNGEVDKGAVLCHQWCLGSGREGA